jgi:hypothetical protein
MAEDASENRVQLVMPEGLGEGQGGEQLTRNEDSYLQKKEDSKYSGSEARTRFLEYIKVGLLLSSSRFRVLSEDFYAFR